MHDSFYIAITLHCRRVVLEDLEEEGMKEGEGEDWVLGWRRLWDRAV